MNGHLRWILFYFCQLKFKIWLFTYKESAIVCILGIDNVFGEGHMYKPEVCTEVCSVYKAIKYSKTWNV